MKFTFLSILFSLFFIASCSSDPLDVDVSGVVVDLDFQRFDQKMFGVNSPQEMAVVNEDLIILGGELYEFYVYDVLRSGSVYDDSIETYLYYFVTDSIMKMVFNDISIEYKDFEIEKEKIIRLFKHLKYHLPDAPIPEKVITYNSAFNYGVISSDKSMGLGLEMYLGQYNRIIQELGFPLYMKEKMSREYLMTDVANSWVSTNILIEDKGETFLSNLIYYGKLCYLIDAMMPAEADHLKIRYTEDEYEWALASEWDVWQFILDMNWVYSADMKVNLRYFEESPTTVGLEGSPGRMGQLIGWQMVKQFMEKNEEYNLQDLIDETNEAKFLKTYKPKNE